MKSTYLTFSLFYDDIEFRVSGTYYPGDPGQTSGPPEKCWPPEPDAFETDDLMIGDVEVSLVIAPPILEKLDEMAREKAAEIYFNQKDF